MKKLIFAAMALVILSLSACEHWEHEEHEHHHDQSSIGAVK